MKIILGLFLCLGLFGCRPKEEKGIVTDIGKPQAAPSATPAGEKLTGAQVIDAFQKASLPLLDLQTLTAETDPIKLLGKPHQYIEKSVWKLKENSGPGEMHKFEVFRNTQDLEARKKISKVVCDAPARMAGHIYSHKNVLLILNYKLPPEEAKKYEDVLKSL